MFLLEVGEALKFFLERIQLGDFYFGSCLRQWVVGLVFFSVLLLWSESDHFNLISHRANQLKSTAFQLQKIIRYSTFQQISAAHR